MKLGAKARYAVMAMVDLARHGNGTPVCLAEIAERQEISLPFLEQVFAKLRRSGLVKSVRGPGGGYLLGDGNYDATALYDAAAAHNRQLVARPRRPNAGRGHRRQSPHRLRSIALPAIGTFLSHPPPPG